MDTTFACQSNSGTWAPRKSGCWPRTCSVSLRLRRANRLMQHLANTRGNAADDSTAPLPWSRRSRDLAMVLWSSFIAAALATVTCFASLDPLEVVGQVGTADPVT